MDTLGTPNGRRPPVVEATGFFGRKIFALSIAAALGFGTTQAFASSQWVRVCSNCCPSDAWCDGYCQGLGHLAGDCQNGDCHCLVG
jgi:hypothetical protein